jgi:hypothetical protein
MSIFAPQNKDIAEKEEPEHFGFPHQTATKQEIHERRRLPAHTKLAWALVVFDRVDRCSSLDGFVVYHW